MRFRGKGAVVGKPSRRDHLPGRSLCVGAKVAGLGISVDSWAGAHGSQWLRWCETARLGTLSESLEAGRPGHVHGDGRTEVRGAREGVLRC